MPSYFLSVDADEDLQGIYAYSEEHWGEEQARKYVFGLYDVFDLIARTPGVGRWRPELGDGIRSFPHVSHVVFFMEWQEEIAIVRVLHKAREIEALFDSYDPVPKLKNADR